MINEDGNVSVPKLMAAVQLIGHGGYDKLVYTKSVPVPILGPGEVLIKVLAAGVNNTDMNTRIGWYSAKAIASTAESATSGLSPADGDWTGGGLTFPRIQGADVCGEIVRLGAGVAENRLGQRVIVQSCLLSLRLGEFSCRQRSLGSGDRSVRLHREDYSVETILRYLHDTCSRSADSRVTPHPARLTLAIEIGLH